jgi:hypothetical protein
MARSPFQRLRPIPQLLRHLLRRPANLKKQIGALPRAPDTPKAPVEKE